MANLLEVGTPVVVPDTPVEVPGTPGQVGTPVGQVGTPVVQVDTPVEVPGTPVEVPGTPGQVDTPVGQVDTPVGAGLGGKVFSLARRVVDFLLTCLNCYMNINWRLNLWKIGQTNWFSMEQGLFALLIRFPVLECYG